MRFDEELLLRRSHNLGSSINAFSDPRDDVHGSGCLRVSRSSLRI